MNKQEAIERIESRAFNIGDTDLVVGLSYTKNIINQINEPQKKVPTNIRPYSIGYRVVSKNGNIFASKNGASVFSLPSEAKKAIQREFGKDDPNFDIGRCKIEEVVIVNFEKLKKFLEEVE